MLRYIAKRLVLMVPTLLGVALLVFLVMRVLPGDIVEARLVGSSGAAVSAETVAAERERLGLDKSTIVQLKDWVVGLAMLDLGTSMWTARPVLDEIASRVPLTLQTAVMATVLAVLVAIPLGTLAALNRGTMIDQSIRLFTVAGIAMPPFWFGMLLIVGLLAVFNWLPPLTYKPIYQDPLHNLSQLIWPAIAIGYRLAALITRVVRSSLLEVLHEDYIRTARAKGVYEGVVIRRHALGNALLPVVTVVGMEFAMLLGGLVVTEQVFNLNGLGKLFIDAVAQNDFMLIQGIVMVIAVFFMIVNLTVDVVCGLLDPRIQLR